MSAGSRWSNVAGSARQEFGWDTLALLQEHDLTLSDSLGWDGMPPWLRRRVIRHAIAFDLIFAAERAEIEADE